MPQMSAFAVQEGVTKSLDELLKAYNIEARGGKVEVVEDMEERGRRWKAGEDVVFTASFEAEEGE